MLLAARPIGGKNFTGVLHACGSYVGVWAAVFVSNTTAQCQSRSDSSAGLVAVQFQILNRI